MSDGLDRRRDGRVRDFLSTVEETYQEALADLHEAIRRDYRKLARRMTVVLFLLPLLVAGGFFAYNRQRHDFAVELCERTNETAEDNIAFVKRVYPKLEPLAREVYKVEPDCEAFVDRTL